MNMFATNSGNSFCHWSERDSDKNKSSVCVSKITVYFNARDYISACFYSSILAYVCLTHIEVENPALYL